MFASIMCLESAGAYSLVEKIKGKRRLKVDEVLSPKEQQQVLDDLLRQTKAGVTRQHWVNVQLKALMKLHPEVKYDPDIIAFKQKVADYEKEMKKDRYANL